MKPLLIALGALAISLFTGIVGAAEVKTTKVSVCLPRFRHEFLSLLVLEAIDQGYFKKRGMDVTTVYSGEKDQSDGKEKKAYNERRKMKRGPISNSPVMVDRGIANQVSAHPEVCQFGSSNVDRYLTSTDIQQHTNPIMVSAYGENYDTHLMVAKNSKIKTVKDLKGKKIRTGQLPTYFATRQILEKDGITVDQVDFERDFDSIDKVQALKDGKIAALVTYMPLTAYMLASGDFRVLKANIVRDYVQPSIPHSLLIVNKGFGAASPEMVENFRLAMMDAYEYLMRNPSEIVNIVERHSIEMNGSPWDVSSVVAEKAGAFVGKVFVADMTPKGDLAAKKSVLCKIKAYNKMMKDKTYFQSEVDLSEWMGVKSKENQCGESA